MPSPSLMPKASMNSVTWGRATLTRLSDRSRLPVLHHDEPGRERKSVPVREEQSAVI